jgi:hypothetical protein
MIFSDLPSPAEASNQTTASAQGFAQAGNRFPLFGIMLYYFSSQSAHFGTESLPHGMIGTLEVEFLGEPSISLSE